MSKVNSAIAGAGTGASVGGPWGAVIGGAAGYLMGSDDDGKAGGTLEDLMKEARNIPLPILKEYYPELYQVVVQLNPEVETAVNLGPSEMQGISTDPALRQAQMNALAKLEEVGATGMSAGDRARQMQIENEVNTNFQGNEGAIMQNMATRGMSGGGTELVARNMNAQNASNRQAQMAMETKAQAEKRALDALMQSGQLSGQMQSQDFSQAAQKAQAADAISKFNATNQQNVIHNNTNTANNAQQWNAQNKQSVAGQNTGLKNDATKYNLNLPQQDYNNNLARYGLVNTAGNNLAQNQQDRANQQNQFTQDMISNGAAAYAKYNEPEDKKKKAV